MTGKDEKGFTLIELVLLVVIVAILAAVVNLGLGSLGSNKPNSAARRLASDLRFAQQLSLTKHNRHGIIFTATSYSVFQNDNTVDLVPRNPSGGSPFTVSMAGDFAGITIDATALTNSIVRFETNGKPSEGAVPAPLAASRQVTFTDTASGSSKSITITQETGKITD